MSPRKLNIIIAVLYALAAFCLLGMGSVRQKLEEVQAAQLETAAPEQALPAPDGQEVEALNVTKVEELEQKLTIWQVTAIILFATASLLLIFKEKLIRQLPPSAE